MLTNFYKISIVSYNKTAKKEIFLKIFLLKITWILNLMPNNSLNHSSSELTLVKVLARLKFVRRRFAKRRDGVDKIEQISTLLLFTSFLVKSLEAEAKNQDQPVLSVNDGAEDKGESTSQDKDCSSSQDDKEDTECHDERTVEDKLKEIDSNIRKVEALQKQLKSNEVKGGGGASPDAVAEQAIVEASDFFPVEWPLLLKILGGVVAAVGGIGFAMGGGGGGSKNNATSSPTPTPPTTSTPPNSSVDNVSPTITITADHNGLNAGATALLTFRFSEAPKGLPSISPNLGQLSELVATADPLVFTATLVPPSDTAAGSITLVIQPWTDIAGNTGSLASTPLAIAVDTVRPTVVLESASSHNQTITLTYSEVIDKAHPPLASSFTVLSAGHSLRVDHIEIDGSTVTLFFNGGLAAGSLTVRYEDTTAGDDVNAIQDLLGNDAASFSTGVVADGYLSGARVYIDADHNGEIDEGDYYVGITDANGNFFMPDAAPVGAIIAVGGVNKDTGIPNTMVLKAPVGSTSLNPLTTLVQGFLETLGDALPTDPALLQVAIAHAASAVALSLGIVLPEGQSLTDFDPIASNDVSIQKVAAQIATIAMVAQESGGGAAAANSVFSNLVNLISASDGQGAKLDLSSASTLSSMLVGVTLDSSVIDSIHSSVASIAAATSLTDIAKVQSETLDKIAPATLISVQQDPNDHDNLPTVRVVFNKSSMDGTASVAGDTIDVFNGAIEIAKVVLAQSDIDRGYIDVELSYLPNGSHSLSASSTDVAGNVSLGKTFIVTIAHQAPLLTGQVVVLAEGEEDVAYSISAAELLQGYSDVDHGTLRVAQLRADHATVKDNGDGTYTLTPSANYNGPLHLSYAVVDGQGGEISASQSLSLIAVNDAPALTAAQAVLQAGREDTAYTVIATDLLQGYSDVEHDTLSIKGLRSDHASVTDNGDGTYTLTLAPTTTVR